MGRSQETAGKKEVRTRKEKKRKAKEQKRAKKKSGSRSSFDDMIAYVDEFGMITSTPPDPSKKTVVDADSIELNVTKNRPDAVNKSTRHGVVTFFNDSKGFGFIRDGASGERIFVHANNLQEPVKENDQVEYEIMKGPKGSSASNVRCIKA